MRQHYYPASRYTSKQDESAADGKTTTAVACYPFTTEVGPLVTLFGSAASESRQLETPIFVCRNDVVPKPSCCITIQTTDSKRENASDQWPSPGEFRIPAQRELDSDFLDSQLVNENFSLSSWLLLGCSIQSLLLLIVPASLQIYVYSFAATLLVARVVNAVLINLNVLNNPYLQDSIRRRTTALVADEAGNLNEPGQQGVTVLMLGAKSNHPYGFFAPEFLQTFAWVDKMNKEFDIVEKMPKGCEFFCACSTKLLRQHEQECGNGARSVNLLTNSID